MLKYNCNKFNKYNGEKDGIYKCKNQGYFNLILDKIM